MVLLCECRWKPQKDMEGHQHSSQAVPAFIKAVVFFYVSPHCPYSKAVSSVIACLPKFFPPTVVFFAVDVGTLPRNLVLNNGVVATPRVRMLRKVSPGFSRAQSVDSPILEISIKSHDGFLSRKGPTSIEERMWTASAELPSISLCLLCICEYDFGSADTSIRWPGKL